MRHVRSRAEWISFAAVTLVLACGSAPHNPTRQDEAGSSRTISLAAAPDQFFTVDGFRIRYRKVGQGDPIILVHGLAGRLETWDWLADSLARSYHVIAFDGRGRGLSAKSGDPQRYGRAMANDVTGLLDHLGLRRAHLVGHSLGAMVVAYVAARAPDRVLTVSMLALPTWTDSADHTAGTEEIARDLDAGVGMLNFFRERGANDSLARILNRETMAHSDAASLAAIFRSEDALALPDSVASRLRASALMIVGMADDLLHVDRQFASRAGIRLIELPGANHASIVRDPRVLAAIRDHIAAHAE